MEILDEAEAERQHPWGDLRQWLDVKNNMGQTFLSTAVSVNKEKDVCKFVLQILSPPLQDQDTLDRYREASKSVALLCRESNVNGNTILHEVVKKGLQVDAEALADKPVGERCLNQDGFSAFHIAVLNNDIEMVELLLKLYPEFDVNLQTRQNEVAVHLAAKKGFVGMLKKLVEFGADLSLQDIDGSTLLHDCLHKVYLEGGSSAPAHCQKFVDVWRGVVNTAAVWLCKRRGEEIPLEGSKKLHECTREAVFHLRTQIRNKEGLSVVQYAADLGLEDCVMVMLTEEDVFVRRCTGNQGGDESGYEIEITSLSREFVKRREDPSHANKTTTQDAEEEDEAENKIEEKVEQVVGLTLLDTLSKVKPPLKASRILDSIPMCRLSQWQWIIYQWVSVTWIVVHLALMVYITYFVKTDLMLNVASSSNLTFNENRWADLTLMVYGFFLLTAQTVAAEDFWKWIKSAMIRLKLIKVPTFERAQLAEPLLEIDNATEDKGLMRHISEISEIFMNLAQRMIILAFFILAVLAFTFHVQQQRIPYADAKGLCLFCGWLIVLIPGRTYSPMYNVMETVKVIIIKDFTPFLLLYLVIAVGFSCAIFMQFELLATDGAQGCEETSGLMDLLWGVRPVTYELFVTVIGMDSDIKHVTNVSCLFKSDTLSDWMIGFLLTVYAITTVLIFLNMLIAMMGSTLTLVTQTTGLGWQQYQVRFAKPTCQGVFTLTVMTRGRFLT